MGRPENATTSDVRAGIVDGRAIVRQLLARALSLDSRLQVMGAYADWSSAMPARDVVTIWISPAPAPWKARSLSLEQFDVSAVDQLCGRVLEAANAPMSTEVHRPNGRLPQLSAHEQAVLDATAQGLTAADIAEHLGVSVRSAETARRRVMEKLQVNSAAEAVRRFHDLRAAGDADAGAATPPSAET